MSSKYKFKYLALAAAAIAIGLVQGAQGRDTPDVIKAEAEEKAEALAAPDWYQAGAGQRHGEPGTVIRSAAFTGYHLQGVHATRFLYRSRSQFGNETVASALLIVPDRPGPAGGWPVLVWAHGTTGVARHCAPTLSTEVGYYTTQLVKEGLDRNFAVVAVDYSGLGAGGRHEYLWKSSNAKDVAYAATAARLVDPTLAQNWVAIGHSQGGQAVWGVAELMTSLKDPTYRGAVALAPAIDSEPLIDSAATTAGETFYPVFVAYGIQSALPQFDPKTMLLPTGMQAFDRLTRKGCWGLAHALFEPVKPGSVVRKDWTKSPQVRKFLDENQVGDHPIAGPLFIASGESDTAVPVRIVSARTKALCKLGATVKYKSYPGDHGTMMRSSYEDQMAWIMDRFAGRAATVECP